MGPADKETDAWFKGEEIGDAWRLRHGAREGFTRQADDERNALTRTRIDYICFDDELLLPALKGVWLGPWGSEFILPSDHRPIMALLDNDLWLGPTLAVEELAEPEWESQFPPRHWFITSEAERLTAEAAIAAGRLPRKLPRAAFTEAFQADRVVQACADFQTVLSDCNSKLDHSAAWQSYLGVGTAISDELRPLRRDRTMMGEGADKRLPDWARAHIRIRGLRKWLRKLRKKGEKLFLQGANPGTQSVFDSIPEELWDLWHETTALETLQKETDAGNCSEEAQQAWRHAINAARELPLDTPMSDRPTPVVLSRSEWLTRLLRIRITTATRAVRRAHVREKAATGWRKRLLDAHAALAGRTGAIFEVVNPRARPIRVAGAQITQADGSTRWFTDNASLRQSAADLCAATVELNDSNDRRGTRLSPEDRTQGLLDQHFSDVHLGSLREIIAERKPIIAAELLLHAWSAEKLLAAVQNCADKAPGPSGLCYWMVGEGSHDFREQLAGMLNIFQQHRHMPDEARHSFIFPIPKQGAGGNTFEGARQICLLEILTKLVEGGITTAAMGIWEERNYLHPSAHGFRKGMSAGDLAAFVAAVGERYRKSN